VLPDDWPQRTGLSAHIAAKRNTPPSPTEIVQAPLETLISSPLFGKPGAALSPRRMQLEIQFKF